MKVFKPLQTSLIHKTFQLDGKYRLAVAVLFGFPFEGNEPLLESKLWQFIAAEIGKDGILDLGMPKPNGEVLLYGSYFSPNGIPVTADSVRLKIGNIDKVLLVYGNRYWRVLLGPTEPEPIREMPLDYSNAFGGRGYAKNPIGKGMVDVDVFGEMRLPLPNIEHPDQIMTSSGQKPDPAGFGPLDMAWEFRTSKLGTYDDNWLRERWPAYPDDLNWNHFNAAPPDQWLDGFFSCTEKFELFNMHPDKPVLKGQLPPYRTRCFINRALSKNGEIEEINMRAESVWLFPHAETGIVLYRGVIDIQTDDVSDVQNLIVGYENMGDEPREISHYANALAYRLDPVQADKYALNTKDLIPNGARCGFGAATVTEDGPADDSGSTDSIEEWVKEQPLFPRPLDYELINQLRIKRTLSEHQMMNIRRKTSNAVSIPLTPIDIEALTAKLEESEREMKEGYRAQAHLLEEGRPPLEDLEAIRQELLVRLERNEEVAGWDFAGLDLSNMDLSGVNFKGCYLEAVDFSGSKLIGANLEGAIIAFADLTRCDLSRANLKQVNLGSSNLSYANLDGADMSKAILGKSVLWGAKLTNCNLTEVDLFETKLGNVDLSSSVLPNTQFFNLYLSQSKFHKTYLIGSTFTKCSLYGCDFSEATLDESTWIESILDEANFSGASMKNTRFPGGCSLSGAQFVRAVLDSSNFRDTDLSKADFTEAILNMCDFSGSNAQHARFERAIAKKAQFIGADLGEADLSSLNLMEGTLMNSRLTMATLRNANCYGVEFMNAMVGGTDFSGALLYHTKIEKWRPA